MSLGLISSTCVFYPRFLVIIHSTKFIWSMCANMRRFSRKHEKIQQKLWQAPANPQTIASCLNNSSKPKSQFILIQYAKAHLSAKLGDWKLTIDKMYHPSISSDQRFHCFPQTKGFTSNAVENLKTQIMLAMLWDHCGDRPSKNCNNLDFSRESAGTALQQAAQTQPSHLLLSMLHCTNIFYIQNRIKFDWQVSALHSIVVT